MPLKIDPRHKARFIELVALGATQSEACRAVGVGDSTGDRWMRDPKVRSQVNKLADKASGRTDVLEVLEGLLEDDDPKVRMAALILKERLGLFDAGGEQRELPPGVHRVFIEMPREEDEYETLKENEQREYKLYEETTDM